MAQRSEGAPLFHVVAIAEVLVGLNPKEFKSVDVQISAGKIVVPTEHDLLTSVKLLRRYHPSHGVGWPDCLLAATALRLGVAVVTLNQKHFRAFRRLEVIVPY